MIEAERLGVKADSHVVMYGPKTHVFAWLTRTQL